MTELRKDTYISITSLILIVACGLLFRISLLKSHCFGWDDIDHIYKLSNPNSNFLAIIKNSYQDAHPPTRNLILYSLGSISSDPWLLQLVAFLPGTLLIALIYYWLSKALKDPYCGLSGATIVACGILFVTTSTGTRPYSLFCIFLVLYLHFWSEYLQRRNKASLLPLLTFSCLSAVTHYSTALVLAPTVLIGFMVLLTKPTPNEDKDILVKWCLIGAIPILILVSQFILVQELSDGLIRNLSERNRFLGPRGNFQGIAYTIQDLFDLNLFERVFFSNAVLALWITGLGACILYKKSYLTLLSVLVPANAILLDYVGLYPFVPTRHQLPFLLVSLIPISFAWSLIFKLFDGYSASRIWKISIIICSLYYVFPAGFIELGSNGSHLFQPNEKISKESSGWECAPIYPKAVKEHISKYVAQGDYVLASERLINLWKVNGYDFAEWANSLAETCQIPPQLEAKLLHDFDMISNESAQSFLNAKCFSKNRVTRYWCIHCKDILEFKEIRKDYVKGTPITLFELENLKDN